MADGHGGSRTPSKPAPVSGPGRLARRTDGRQPVREMTGLPYGENSDFMDLQSSAPMAEAATPTPAMKAGSAAGLGAQLPVGLSAPTQRPDEPVTAGAPVGPGAGPDILTHQTGAAGAAADMAAFKPWLPMLQRAASQPDVSPRFVQFVRAVRNA